jgi:Domain of unknown function (DUF4188)
MRINNFFAARKWLPALRAMGPMLRELYQHPEKGFLGGEFFLYWRGPALVQYWRSFEDLERFARNPVRIGKGDRARQGSRRQGDRAAASDAQSGRTGRHFA